MVIPPYTNTSDSDWSEVSHTSVGSLSTTWCETANMDVLLTQALTQKTLKGEKCVCVDFKKLRWKLNQLTLFRP